jgi:signal peptidase II
MKSTLLLLLPFTLDRVSKHWVYTYKSDYILNRGIAWSLFHSDSVYGSYLVIGGVVLSVMVILWLAYTHQTSPAYLLMLSGGISNVCDRLLYGGVLDFIHITCKGWSWPLFNLADVSIVIGVIVIWCQQMRYHEKLV